MLPSSLTAKTHEVIKLLRKKEMKISVAESCTGGLISYAITEIPGASDVFERGYVTYSNESKIELLTVPTFYIEEYGAVSFETVVAMAEGALLMSRADISISVTGIAGPDGGTTDKPIGTVFIGCAIKNHETSYEKFFFHGGRHTIRMLAAEAALGMVMEKLGVV